MSNWLQVYSQYDHMTGYVLFKSALDFICGMSNWLKVTWHTLLRKRTKQKKLDKK